MAEPGSDAATELFFGASLVVSSSLLEVEARAALERAGRGGRIPRASVVAVRHLARRFLSEVDSLGVDRAVVRRAGDVAEEHGLRGCDAVHLASFERVPEAVLVSNDADLVHAARSLGYAVAVPDGPP